MAHFASFFKLYIFIPTPLLRSVFREKSRIFSIFREIFSLFTEFECIFLGISQKCRDLEELDTENAVFSKNMRQFGENLPK